MGGVVTLPLTLTSCKGSDKDKIPTEVIFGPDNTWKIVWSGFDIRHMKTNPTKYGFYFFIKVDNEWFKGAPDGLMPRTDWPEYARWSQINVGDNIAPFDLEYELLDPTSIINFNRQDHIIFSLWGAEPEYVPITLEFDQY